MEDWLSEEEKLESACEVYLSTSRQGVWRKQCEMRLTPSAIITKEEDSHLITDQVSPISCPFHHVVVKLVGSHPTTTFSVRPGCAQSCWLSTSFSDGFRLLDCVNCGGLQLPVSSFSFSPGCLLGWSHPGRYSPPSGWPVSVVFFFSPDVALASSPVPSR